jgi:hypothetical protein
MKHDTTNPLQYHTVNELFSESNQKMGKCGEIKVVNFFHFLYYLYTASRIKAHLPFPLRGRGQGDEV